MLCACIYPTANVAYESHGCLTWGSKLQIALNSRPTCSSVTGLSFAIKEDAQPEEGAIPDANPASLGRGLICLQAEASTASEDVQLEDLR